MIELCGNALEDESVEVGVLVEDGLGRKLEVLLLELASDWALVAEDEVDLRIRLSVQSARTEASESAPSCPGKSSQDQT